MLGAKAEAIRSEIRDLDRKFAATPGVEAASQSWGAFPLSGEDEQLFWIDGEPKPASENDMKWALSYVVQPDYINVLKLPLKSGRFFTITTTSDRPPSRSSTKNSPANIFRARTPDRQARCT